MKLSQNRIEEYRENGFLILPNLFSPEEVAEMRDAMERVFRDDIPQNIREKKSGSVRMSMALHLRDETFSRLVRHPRLIEPALQIAAADLYLQQSKINVKAAFEGEVWQWHQDFSSHHHEDGVQQPRALNVHVFLDDVTEFNGPLYFLRGSQKAGAAATWHDTVSTSFPLWVVERDAVRDLADTCPIVSATGPAGTVLIFGDYMVHGSPPNMSPWNRSIFSIILNPVENALTRHIRADHLHHRDTTPIRPLPDDCLLAAAA